MTDDRQPPLRLLPGARVFTLEKLFAQFGDVLIPLDTVRARYFRNLNEETFAQVIGSKRLPLPVTTLETGRKAMKYVEIHHLAAYIETRAYQADESLTGKTEPTEQTT